MSWDVSLSILQYYLYMYIKPFTPCGSDGVTPRPHVASVTIRAHGTANMAQLDFAPEVPGQPFDFGQFTQGNQPTFRNIPIEVAQMA